MVTSKLILCFLINCFLFMPAFCEVPIIRSLHIMSNITYTYAKTLVTSRVLNPANVSQEVTFKVVLPEEAFITGFVMTIKNIPYEAYIKETEEAKKDYDAAVSAGKSAGHIFQSSFRNSKDFTVNVNVEAEEKVKFELTYEELLTRKNRTYNNVININPQQIVRDLSIIVNIEDALNIKNVEIPQFKMTNKLDQNDAENLNAKKKILSPKKVQVEWSPTEEEQKELNAEGLNGHMTVKYDLDSSQMPQQLLVDQDGYFVHIFRNDELTPLNKHVVFVLDVSGSMYGIKMKQLKQAMEKILSDLSENDYFSIVLFSVELLPWKLDGVDLDILDKPFKWDVSEPTKVTVTEDYVIPANKTNIELAKQFMRNISPVGGTNINGGLRISIDIANKGRNMFQNSASPIEPMIIFLTDGEPNYEESDPDRIIANVKERNIGKVTIFSLSFGDDADLNFLKKLSLASNGFSRRIYSESDADLQLNNFYKEVASPVLSDVKFEYLPDQVENITPQKKKMFSGSSILVLGKAKDNNKISAALSAMTPQGKKIFKIPSEEIIQLPPEDETRTFGRLEKMWAYKTIKSLLDQNTVSKNETIKNKAKELALEYKFVTPLTSLVVVKPNASSVMNDDDSVASGVSKMLSAPRGSPIAVNRIFNGFKSYGSSTALMARSDLGGALINPIRWRTLVLPPNAFVSGRKAMKDPIARDALSRRVNNGVTPGNIPYANVTWLNQTVSEDGLFLQPPLTVDEHDVIALKEPNIVYNSTNCFGTNKCRHFIFCILPVFVDSPTAFQPFKCHIDPNFLGVCCPF